MRSGVIFIGLFLICTTYLFSQQYLGNFTIRHQKCDRYSQDNSKLKKETNRSNTIFRNLEFDLLFDEGCKYIYSDATHQMDCQKLIKLCTGQNGETKNSIRIGWYWNDKKEKVELAFYGHFNHLEGIWGDSPGRELSFLNYAVQPGEWVHVKMALGKKGMFMSIDDQAVIVSRNIFSWSPLPEGETTYLRASSYFENRDPENMFCKGALNDMEFHVANLVIDNPEFEWHGGVCDYTAENIIFMNSHFNYVDQGPYTYHALRQIMCSNRSASRVSRLPFEQPFTVVEPMMDVSFSAGESILLKNWFLAKEGAYFSARIDQEDKAKNVDVGLLSEALRPEICCKADYASVWYLELYKDIDYKYPVFSDEVKFSDGEACITLARFFDSGVLDTSSRYYGISTIQGYCSNVTLHHILKPESETDYGVKHLEGGLESNIILFPNPSRGAFYLDDLGGNDLICVNVYSLNGVKLESVYFMEGKTQRLDISHMAKGVYILEIVCLGEVAIKRLVLQ